MEKLTRPIIKGSQKKSDNKEPKDIPSDKSETFIGQNKIVEKINLLVDKAKASKVPLPHLLFVGEDGMGKETLARIISKKLGAKITATSGYAIGQAGDLIGMLTNLQKGDIFFINYIEKLSKVVEEFLYPALHSLQLDFVIDKGPYAKTIKFNLKQFTLIVTTSEFSQLDDNLINYIQPASATLVVNTSEGVL